MQLNQFIKLIFLLLPNLSFASTNAQTYAGAGYGTFNVPGAMSKFRGWGPMVKLERVLDNEVVVAYFDLSRFTKKYNNGSVSLYNDAGNRVGSADAETEYAYLYAQTGLKILFLEGLIIKRFCPMPVAVCINTAFKMIC